MFQVGVTVFGYGCLWLWLTVGRYGCLWLWLTVGGYGCLLWLYKWSGIRLVKIVVSFVQHISKEVDSND